MKLFEKLFGGKERNRLTENDKIICWNGCDKVWEHNFSEFTDVEINYLLDAFKLEIEYTREGFQTFIDREVPRVMEWLVEMARIYKKRVNVYKQLLDTEKKLRDRAQERVRAYDLSRRMGREDLSKMVQNLEDLRLLKSLEKGQSKTYLYIKSGRTPAPERLDPISEDRVRALVISKIALYLAYFRAGEFSDSFADVQKMLEGAPVN